ncbi:MAG: YeeE/YedE family protein [Verrucomicrobiales bacterium]|nr:YeeE/YedE family protein [Verrucomicrobiales bacterium]
MSTHYLPWWVGGPLLAAVALGYPLLTRAALGVSGAVSRVLSPRPSAKAGEPAPETATTGTGAASPIATAAVPDCNAPVVSVAPVTEEAATDLRTQASVGRGTNLFFLLGIVGGGAITALWSGTDWGQSQYSPRFHHFFGHGWTSGLVLFLGGLLVGFGTRWSGGCTSGHGLSGVGRLQPASLVATAVFFGVAIGVSFLLEALWP